MKLIKENPLVWLSLGVIGGTNALSWAFANGAAQFVSIILGTIFATILFSAHWKKVLIERDLLKVQLEQQKQQKQKDTK